MRYFLATLKTIFEKLIIQSLFRCIRIYFELMAKNNVIRKDGKKFQFFEIYEFFIFWFLFLFFF